MAYGKIEVMFEEGMCEVDLFVQDAEGARINDGCVLAARGCAVRCGCPVCPDPAVLCPALCCASLRRGLGSIAIASCTAEPRHPHAP